MKLKKMRDSIGELNYKRLNLWTKINKKTKIIIKT